MFASRNRLPCWICYNSSLNAWALSLTWVWLIQTIVRKSLAFTNTNSPPLSAKLGSTEIEIDEDRGEVRFVTPPDKKPGDSILGMTEQTHCLRQLPIIKCPSSLYEKSHSIFERLSETGFLYESGHIVLGDISVINDELLETLFDSAFPKETLMLDNNSDLLGFTVGEYESFMGAIRRWSYCCSFGFLFSITKKGKEQCECMPTQCVNRDEFIHSMTQLTDLSAETVERIIDRLTYDWTFANSG